MITILGPVISATVLCLLVVRALDFFRSLSS